MLNANEDLELRSTSFPLIYPAEVVNDTDPDGATSGRVKVRVWPMMKELDVAVLPWAIPAFGLFEGAGTDVGSFTVPEIGSYVYVFFAAGSVYSPVYFAAAPRKTDGPSSRKVGNKVWKSRSGHEIIVSDVSGEEEISIKHKDNNSIVMNGTAITVTHKDGHSIVVDGTDITINHSGSAGVSISGGSGVPGVVKVTAGKVALGTSVVELLDQLTKALDDIVTGLNLIPYPAAATIVANTAIKTIMGSI